ncbi:DUF4198 domain-containing protein [Stieleria maiorica]|nr:DUF4198 domain-containing protein [Stieleria maiorica]
MLTFPRFLAPLCLLIVPCLGSAHDVWLQTDSPIVRTGENVQVDLRLGNHGNHHRDFKLAGRVTVDWVSLDHRAPDGTRNDLRKQLFATASAEKEGYWTTPIAVSQPGVHCVVQSLQRVMNHGRPVRSVRTAKTYFLVADSLDSASVDQPIHSQPDGLPFELVLQSCPISETVVGRPITVVVLHHGKPLPDVVVSFIPEGQELSGEFDPEYEVRADDRGEANFVPDVGRRYLIVAHHKAEDERTDEYDYTSYASTITVHVANQTPWAMGN